MKGTREQVAETFVCCDCVDDKYLKGLVCQKAIENECSYCARKSNEAIAAPFEDIFKAIEETAFAYFADPTDSGMPYDGGFLLEPVDTSDVLETIGLRCNDGFRDDVIQAFEITDWVPATQGHWGTPSLSDYLVDSWNTFAHAVKAESRYFFHTNETENSGPYDPLEPASLLNEIGELVTTLNLIRELGQGTSLFRCRVKNDSENWQLNADCLGPPPSEKATAGRMNPTGIPYFYLAIDQATAIAETTKVPPCSVGVGEYLVGKGLQLLDLTKLPSPPTIFDREQRPLRENLIFLERFRSEIAKPIEKNDRAHIEYIPTQIVAEYFGKVFKTKNKTPLDGIIYPSAVRPGGINVVYFRNKPTDEQRAGHLTFKGAKELHFPNWDELKKAV